MYPSISLSYTSLVTFPLVKNGLRKPYFLIGEFDSYQLQDKISREIFETRKHTIRQFIAQHFPSFLVNYILLFGGTIAIIILALFTWYSSELIYLRVFLFLSPVVFILLVCLQRASIQSKLRKFEKSWHGMMHNLTLEDAPRNLAWLPKRLPGMMSFVVFSWPHYAIDVVIVHEEEVPPRPEAFFEFLPPYAAVDPLMPPPPVYANHQRAAGDGAEGSDRVSSPPPAYGTEPDSLPLPATAHAR
ncbi:uncharacterized protein VTP21DRAFT_10916 [Calcarisporiella thermophila]|uniref:uncharacterized protein n=1 Tax=Calcarisporiella thermophila TaxID=911321 RepID=UPI003743DAC8